jgi:hypothetical protein
MWVSEHYRHVAGSLTFAKNSPASKNGPCTDSSGADATLIEPQQRQYAAINRKSANEQNRAQPVRPTNDVRTCSWMTLICCAVALHDYSR